MRKLNNGKESIMSDKMRAGELRIQVEQEEILWYDRKRVTIFALPWSFTKYTLTASKLTVESGLLNTHEEEVKLYRVTDVAYTQSIWERIGKTGTITLLSNDTSSPTLVLKHVKNAKTVKEAISHAVELARQNKGVKMSEMIGDADPR
jgi:arginyl-tRNA synthetase